MTGKRRRQPCHHSVLDNVKGGARTDRRHRQRRPGGVRGRLREMDRQGVQVFSAHSGPGGSDEGVLRHILHVPAGGVVLDRMVAYCMAVLSVDGMRIPGPGPLCPSCLAQVRL